MTIGEEVLIHGYIDEIRKDIVIIRNEGGYFGTVPEEIRSSSENPNKSEIPTSCGDAISRQAVLDGLASIAKAKAKSDAQKSLMGRVMFFTEQLPSVTPQQRTGRWIEHFDEIGKWYECDQCHTDWGGPVNYCPNCGCAMKG